MAAAELVLQIRRALGPVGAFVGLRPEAPTVEVQWQGIRRLESVGWRALWTNEIVGTDALVRAALWLAATDQMVIGTCVANVWARPAQTAHAAARQLAEAYPGRFVLGLGVGRAEQAAAVGRDFGSPSEIARDYLLGTAGATYPRVLGANGPRLLALAAELADGALPAGTPPKATAEAREILGADRLLIVYVSLAASDEPAEVVEAVGEHRAAGADHVIVGMPYDTDFGSAVERMERLMATLGRGSS